MSDSNDVQEVRVGKWNEVHINYSTDSSVPPQHFSSEEFIELLVWAGTAPSADLRIRIMKLLCSPVGQTVLMKYSMEDLKPVLLIGEEGRPLRNQGDKHGEPFCPDSGSYFKSLQELQQFFREAL